ncbi:EAL domain-containing protein [Sphingomonas sp.]|uniref:putative bifunctional diguanylate cyclase/phosphodiesterase n=1 Tax=Sphingomonas sp. TaxID=28214 RepID=UPI0025F1BC61|nr:EAL domain-containing protein [Sphingomonas sp.]MBV9527213.1 EAL domain-containing protein [Sphingomonas sp.]
MRSFRSLSARLTVQFALLFAGAMLAVSAALSTFIAGSASRQVADQLQSSGAVYDRLWAQRAHELQNAAQLLARDFGFRAAVATRDQATMQSALRNAASRLRVRTAFIVSADGKAVSIDSSIPASETAGLWDPLDDGRLTGVAVLAGRPRQLVAAPVMAPTLIGWVVFAADLDRHEMRSLERLSAIPLHAAVIAQDNGRWSEASGSMSVLDGQSAALAQQHVGTGATFEMTLGRGRSIALAKRLPTFSGDGGAILLLAYPRSEALADAHKLQFALAVMTLLGLLAAALATWRAAGRITRPLARLDEAAGRLAAGEHVQVRVRGSDELARLADSFNDMAGKIAEREQRITQLAFNDVLTGLPNRTMFQQQLEHLLRVSSGSGSHFALHCLDLDQFKVINDTLGHPAGDALLVEAAQRLMDAAKGHFVARLGGDEFVVLQVLGGDRNAIDLLAAEILRSVRQPLNIDGHEIAPSTSIGIAIAPGDGADAETLLRSADLALYRAKEGGRGAFAFFEESLNQRAQQRRQIEADLRTALERDEFELFYQPLFDLEQNRICSFEALIRWRHPERGMVSPAEFVPVAEDTGLINAIGSWVIREACAQAVRWPDHVRIAVNVSPVQFHRAGLQETIFRALADSGLAPQRLELEITESIFLEGGDATLKLLHSLRGLGVRIALDDFGTGYSSLSYLLSFPFDKLKIDRSFIHNLLTREGASAIVGAITELAQALGIETTAEGVEETAQLLELRSHGCSSVQGYLFAEPMSLADVQQLFHDDKLAMQSVA